MIIYIDINILIKSELINMRKIIAVLGDAIIEAGSLKEKLAFETGKAIIDAGCRLQCGGMSGVMEAACKGARSSEKYREGDIIGILPSFDITQRNDYVDIAIPTGLDVYRNVIVASASACIAIGGGAGTLCEIGNAWALKRMLMAYANVEGWSAKVAGTKMDSRNRYPDIPEDKVYPLTDASQIAPLIEKYADRYNVYHHGITINH